MDSLTRFGRSLSDLKIGGGARETHSTVVFLGKYFLPLSPIINSIATRFAVPAPRE